MLVVADSSALVALATCSALDLLPALFDDVFVPQGVYDEVVIPGKPQAAKLQEFLQKRVMAVKAASHSDSGSDLGQGEAEAIALYKLLAADLLLIDDRRARAIAEMQQIRCIGTLGVLLAAKRRGIVAEIAPYIEKLRASPLHYSHLLLIKVLQLAQEI
jgi:uncharacterized protein